MFEYLRFQIRIAKAFTLAEVLITLTIIGVVAALTIPVLIQSIQDVQLKIAFKKDYSVITAAYTSLVQDNGGSLKGVYNSASEFANVFKDKFRYIKYCPLGTASDCLPQLSQYKYLDGTNGIHFSGCETYLIDSPGNLSIWSAIVLPDGGVITITDWSKNCDASDSYMLNTCTVSKGSINIDVNGAKGPNVLGKDLFIIIPFETMVKPAGIPDTGGYGICSTYSCKTTQSGFGCAAQVLQQ